MTAPQKMPLLNISPSTFRAIETELSKPPFYGIGLGPALNDSLMIEFFDGLKGWGLLARWKNRARYLKYWLRPLRSQKASAPLPDGSILVTWYQSTPRLDEMILPVLAELDGSPHEVLYGLPNVAPRIPAQVPARWWDQVLSYDVAAWRAEYRRCRPEWSRRLKGVCRNFNLPAGSFETLFLNLLLASQMVAGCLDFLERNRPALVLTEYDRNRLWSCLVLAARRLGIPTITLVHGIIGTEAVSY